MPGKPATAIKSIKNAVKRGRISEDRIDESVSGILKKKYEMM